MENKYELDSAPYEDFDDCLTAACADVAETAGIPAWAPSATWGSVPDGREDRSVIVISVDARHADAMDAAGYEVAQ